MEYEINRKAIQSELISLAQRLNVLGNSYKLKSSSTDTDSPKCGFESLYRDDCISYIEYKLALRITKWTKSYISDSTTMADSSLYDIVQQGLELEKKLI
jgi:hypothetical protein